MIRPIHVTEDRIRELAYRLWLGDGQPQGKSAEHWEKARDLLAHGFDPEEGGEGVAAGEEFVPLADPGGQKSPTKRRPSVARGSSKRPM